MLAVLCIGDSITRWDQSYCDQSIHTTDNIAEVGETTEGWLDPNVHTNRIIPALAAQPIDVVSILLYTNDVAQQIEPLQVEANLRSLVAMLESEGVVDIVLSIPPYFQAEEIVPLHAEYNDRLDEIAPLIVAIAVDPNNVARFGVDWRTLSLPYPDVWSDPVHPDVAGHAIARPFVDAALIPNPFVPALSPAGIALLFIALGVTAFLMLRNSDSAP